MKMSNVQNVDTDAYPNANHNPNRVISRLMDRILSVCGDLLIGCWCWVVDVIHLQM